MAWLDPFRYRRKITIDNTKIDAALSNFPITIPLSASAGLSSADLSDLFSEISYADRKKIAITISDEETQCYVEVENWDVAGTKGLLHVKVPSISDSADTELYLYYDSSHPDNDSYVGDPGDAIVQNVWDSNFVAVHHLSQDPSGGAGSILDSTSNANNGTPVGCTDSGDLIDSNKGGKAIEFDEDDDYINCQSGSNLDDISLLTVEALFNADDFGESSSGRIWQKSSVNSGPQILIIGTGSKFAFIRGSSGGLGQWSAGSITADGSTWHHAAACHDRSNINNDPVLYVDGAAPSVTEDFTPSGSWDNDAAYNAWIGARSNSGADREFDGKIAEIRISNKIREAEWIKATYNGFFDTLITWSDIEESHFIDSNLGLSAEFDAQNLTDAIESGLGISGDFEALNTSADIDSGIGFSGEFSTVKEIEKAVASGLGLSCEFEAIREIDGVIQSGLGLSSENDFFAWSDWLRLNRFRAIERFYFTLTGAADGETDIEIPISSFAARKRTGQSTYLSVVIKDINQWSAAIAARSNGEMIIELAYLLDGLESVREEILRANLEDINIYEGPDNRSIILTGHKTQSFAGQVTTLTDPIYRATENGRRIFRFSACDPYLNPGDTLVVGQDSLTVDYVTYNITAGGYKAMEVREIG